MQNTVWYRTFTSVTFWFNLVTFSMAVAALPELTELLPSEWLRWIVLINPIGNLFIRQFLTATPITRSAADRARKKKTLVPTHPMQRWDDIPVANGPSVTDRRVRRATERPPRVDNNALVGRTITTTGAVDSAEDEAPPPVKKKRPPKPKAPKPKKPRPAKKKNMVVRSVAPVPPVIVESPATDTVPPVQPTLHPSRAFVVEGHDTDD